MLKPSALFATLLSVTVWVCAATPPPAAPAFHLVQPECLSAVADTAVAYEVAVPSAGPARLDVILSTEDGLFERTAISQGISLQAGATRGTFVIAPASLSGVNLHEDVTLTARITTADGSVLEDDLDATVLPEESIPETGTWLCALSVKPALIYTNQNTTLTYSVVNPKAQTTKINLHLKFMNDKKSKVVALKVSLHVPPGASSQDVLIPSSYTTAARAKGDTLLKTTLKVAGVVKKKDLALLDFDFKCSASVDPASGTAPLNVFFTGNATGGVPPYNFAWNFGDGGTSSGQNTAHKYTAAGTFSSVMTVTDSLAASLSAPPSLVTVTQPPMTLTCGVSPLDGVLPLTVNFTATATGGSGTYTWDWNFGDGSAHSTLQNPSHLYGTAGQYAGNVTVTDGTNTRSCTTPVITVRCPDLAVSCNVTPTVGKAPLTVGFTSTPSGGCGNYVYDWDFGDGTTHSTLQNPGHIYANAGTYYPKLTVTDSGLTAQCSPTYIVVSAQ